MEQTRGAALKIIFPPSPSTRVSRLQARVPAPRLNPTTAGTKTVAQALARLPVQHSQRPTEVGPSAEHSSPHWLRLRGALSPRYRNPQAGACPTILSDPCDARRSSLAGRSSTWARRAVWRERARRRDSLAATSQPIAPRDLRGVRSTAPAVLRPRHKRPRDLPARCPRPSGVPGRSGARRSFRDGAGAATR